MRFRRGLNIQYHAMRAVLVLCLLGFAVKAAAADDAKDCTLNVKAELDMRTLPDGRISIPAKFQNRDVFFLVDTAGVISTIDPDIAASVQLRPHGTASRLYGVGGVVLNQYVTAESFSIGKLNAKNFDFFIEPVSWRGGGGTIAPEILRAYDVDFDFANGKFHLISSDHCPGNVIYWTSSTSAAIVPMEIEDRSGHIRIPVRVDGKEIKATVDTGSVVSVLSLRAARRYLDFDEKSPDVKVLGGGAHQSYSYPFKTMNFEGITVNNPYIVILPDADMRYLDSDIILGVGILRQLHMYIAYKERKLYLTAATAH